VFSRTAYGEWHQSARENNTLTDTVFCAGVAVADITPPVGSLMAAFPRGAERTPRRAKGVHDQLQAKALVLSDTTQTVAICSCDVALFRAADVAAVRESVAERVPALAGDRVQLCATHTHSSPENTYLFGGHPDDPAVIRMQEQIADAVVCAFADREPVTVHRGRTSVDLNHNRRVTGADGRSRMVLEHEPEVTTGVTDPELVVLRFDGMAGPIAVLWNYTAHALTAGPANDFYTADYPGVTNALVEREFPGATALFCNGAAGNVHPRRCMRADFAMTDEIGMILGQAVADSARDAAPAPVTGIRFGTGSAEFANRVDPSLQVRAEYACLQLGDLAIGFVPGECFVEFQLEFKRRVLPRLGVLIGFVNDWVGYVPTRESYAAGGYGVDLCTSDPPAYSRTAMPPGAGETLFDGLCQLAVAERSRPET